MTREAADAADAGDAADRTTSERLRSFRPVVAPGARLLVLGSLPGAASLDRGEYYAHPRNRFWVVMERLFDVPAEAPYDARLRELAEARVGLWDVIGRAAREGSLDSAIDRATEEPNDIAGLLASHATIGTVALNGRKAEASFRRWIAPRLPDEVAARVAFVALPSTSPANARFGVDDLVEAWGAVVPSG